MEEGGSCGVLILLACRMFTDRLGDLRKAAVNRECRSASYLVASANQERRN